MIYDETNRYRILKSKYFKTALDRKHYTLLLKLITVLLHTTVDIKFHSEQLDMELLTNHLNKAYCNISIVLMRFLKEEGRIINPDDLSAITLETFPEQGYFKFSVTETTKRTIQQFNITIHSKDKVERSIF